MMLRNMKSFHLDLPISQHNMNDSSFYGFLVIPGHSMILLSCRFLTYQYSLSVNCSRLLYLSHNQHIVNHQNLHIPDSILLSQHRSRMLLQLLHQQPMQPLNLLMLGHMLSGSNQSFHQDFAMFQGNRSFDGLFLSQIESMSQMTGSFRLNQYNL